MTGPNPSRVLVRRPIQDRQAKARSAPPTPGDLRPTGIRVLDRVAWGSHACVFYETPQDLLDTCVSYFDAGLSNNEFCVWAISDPITVKEAESALRRGVAGGDRYLISGQMEILPGREWYLGGDGFDPKRITGGWSEKLRAALADGYEGLRVSGNAFWMEAKLWKDFCAYEHELDRALAGQKMIALCTYSLRASRSVDLLDAARAHQFTIARRHGRWEFLLTPELREAKREIEKLNVALDVLSNRIPRLRRLTARERTVLSHIIRGESSKEAARVLRISPRTVDFHRANIIRKLGAKNAVDLVRRVIGDETKTPLKGVPG